MAKVTSARCQSSQSITATTPMSVMTSATTAKSPLVNASLTASTSPSTRVISRPTGFRSKARPSRSSNSTAASGTRDLLLELLDPPEPGVEAARADEVRVPPLLHDTSRVQHHDAVGELGCAQPVGHEEDRASLREGAELRGDLLLLCRVHRRKGIVEDEDRRPPVVRKRHVRKSDGRCTSCSEVREHGFDRRWPERGARWLRTSKSDLFFWLDQTRADDLLYALHRRQAAPHDRQRPAQRDRGPREVREIAVERGQRAEGQPAVDDRLAPHPEDDQRPDAGDEPHERRE